MYKKQNNKILKENRQLSKKANKLETHNLLISRQAYKWLQEKKSWQYKYERQKLKTQIYKEERGTKGIDALLQETLVEEVTSTSRVQVLTLYINYLQTNI